MSNNKETVFEAIVLQENSRIYALCFRLTGNPHEAEDLCQETFARAFRYFEKFEGRSQVSTWLYRIALNTWKNALRAKKRRPLFSFLSLGTASVSEDGEEPLEPEGKDPVPESAMEKEESAALLQQALLELEPEDREIVVLRDLEEKSYEDIGETLEIPVGTVKSRLSRAREALRSKLIPLLKAKGEIR